MQTEQGRDDLNFRDKQTKTYLCVVTGKARRGRGIKQLMMRDDDSVEYGFLKSVPSRLVLLGNNKELETAFRPVFVRVEMCCHAHGRR